MPDYEAFEIERLAVMICYLCGNTQRKVVEKTSYGFCVTCPGCGEIILEDGPGDELDEYI